MSGTPATAPAPEVNIPVKPEPVTSTDIPADGGLDGSLQPTDKGDGTPGAPQPDAPAEGQKPSETPTEAKTEASKPLKKSPFQSRIDGLTAQKAQAEREKAEALAQVELYKAMAEGKTEGKLAPTQAEIDRLVEQRATQLETQRKSQRVITSGAAEYSDFTDRCNIVAALGAGDRPDFMQVISDPDIIPDGHKVIALLAENPEVAAQIVDPSLSTAQMSARLVKFQLEHSKPAQPGISKLPPPIKPIDGTAKATEIPPERRTMAQEAAAFYAGRAKRFAKGK